MDSPLTYDIENETVSEFVTEADWIPSFWNFLLGLDRNDLIAELIQNDLDQNATRTVISFEQDRLVCEGNGKPVDPEGWQRLRKIQGAGDSVPPKRGRIGVKNHGLKTAFTIGDEIRISSDGQSVSQTLYARGRDSAPRPGASPEPRPDPQAPPKGCRVIIKYRDRNIEPHEGEAIVFDAIEAQDIDDLFKAACSSTPEQFVGIVSPGVVPRYEIILRHWQLGEARFVFSCGRPRKARGIEIFRRRCSVSGTASSLPDNLQEEAGRRLLPLDRRLRRRIADFYRSRNRFFVEVSWPVDGRGKPRTGTGRFRYPIGYPEGLQALTGHGASFNAPFVSDTERHGLALNDETNNKLREACETLLVDVIARHIIPRWGPDGLNPLVPSPRLNNEDEAVRPLLATLARRGAVPTLGWRDAADRLIKTKKRKTSSGSRHVAIRRRPSESKRYQFVVPVATWREEAIHPSLSVICPKSERQLDPRVHQDIVRLLADGGTDGFCENFITFDENDALSRAKGEGNQFFAASNNLEQEFSQPLIARYYLDVIEESIEEGKCNAETGISLREALLLPDVHAKPARFQTLHASAPLPADIPGLRLPPILHEDLASHPIFRRIKWHRPKYTMEKFLGGGVLQDADEQTCKLFWKWLCRNERSIGPRERTKLADIAIWPDADGKFCKLSDLCDLRSRRVATILGDSIRRPHEHVRQLSIFSSGKKRRTSIRCSPSQEEIADWLERRLAPLVPDDTPDADTITALKCFETDLTILLKNPVIARMLNSAEITLPALAQDGSIRPREGLVLPSKNIERLALRKRFLLKNNRCSTALNKLSPALSESTTAMLICTLDEDRENFGALQARLRQFMALTERSNYYRDRLSSMEILPVNGEPRSPNDLAFKSTRGDYWGNWKTQISAKGLSQNDQRRYREAGVTSAFPTSETSRAFFEWLSQQDAAVLKSHVSCVLRHIVHQDKAESWAEVFTDTPFIAAENSRGLKLVSLHTARRRPVYLPDVEKEMADAVIANDPSVLLVIDRVKEVSAPISEPLRRLGVKSLREKIGEPEQVVGNGNIQQAPDKVLHGIAALRSPEFRRTFRKRLDELGVESDLLRNDWYDRLSRIKEIRSADSVDARYRFRRKPYPLAVDAGFDPDSGTFWIKQGHGLRSLYEAIAEQLVFKPTAQPLHFMALERVLELKSHDPSFGSPDSTILEDEESISDEEAHDTGSESSDDDIGEAVFGHSPFKPDPRGNVPSPSPISSISSIASPHGEHRGSNGNGPSKGSSNNKPAPKLEKKHIEELKQDHYASHCQMCLCKRPPQELAPVGSYVEWEEVRRHVVEAHHVDPKSAGGARHAGNLILLCKLHHDNYGRRLTRIAITDALRSEKKAKVIRFGRGSDALSELKGQSIEIEIPDTGEVIEVFFTNDHAAYWLSPRTLGTATDS